MNNTTVSVKQVESLRDEAAVAGDSKQVELCERALAGDAVAWAECERVMADAAAQRS